MADLPACPFCGCRTVEMTVPGARERSFVCVNKTGSHQWTESDFPRQEIAHIDEADIELLKSVGVHKSDQIAAIALSDYWPIFRFLIHEISVMRSMERGEIGEAARR